MLWTSYAIVGWVGGSCCAQRVELVDVNVDANAAVLVVLLRGLGLQLGRLVLVLGALLLGLMARRCRILTCATACALLIVVRVNSLLLRV